MHKLVSFLFFLVACCIAAGCQNEKDNESATVDDEDFSKIPGMVTTDVSMLVSDSGGGIFNTYDIFESFFGIIVII